MRIAALTLVAAAALVLTGCTPGAHPSATPSPKATPVFRSDAEALAAAEKAYKAYRSVAEDVLASGGVSGSKLEEVATGTLLREERSGDKKFREGGLRAVGKSTLKSFELEQAKLVAAPTQQAVVLAYACLDVSAVDVIDQSGSSVVAPDRSPLVSYEVTFDTVNGHLLPARQEPWDSGGVCK